MRKIYCPFVQGECVPKCLFNNGCLDEGDPDNCDLRDAVMVIRSLGERDSQIDKRLSAIASNTSSDQTESYGIKSVLEDIKDILKED